ncbi:uncharacterized protein EI90DRAFT_3013902 [Cantharellus anzutake]|uniref:uncharacterized protein n=1 Tax=Cantharellus anzutake TaxID=1750568 RepID=UPI00190484CA|nr:uncharacterized protein EI90DRAFT_3013902 [Cantharellus anzutake]KAF8336920.1 hypothetical protein EI90DRAFT_3013902 [Cantharellus anzutake]
MPHIDSSPATNKIPPFLTTSSPSCPSQSIPHAEKQPAFTRTARISDASNGARVPMRACDGQLNSAVLPRTHEGHKRVPGSIPSDIKRHYYCQAAREEIREVINDVEPRTTHHPLPATQRFSNFLEQARRLSLVNDPATLHQEISSQFQIRQQSDAFTLAASGVSSSATMESTPAESILQFDPLLFDPSSVHPIHDSVNLVDGAPDRVVYLSPTGSEGPSHHSRPSTLPAHPEPDGTPQDIHVVIESLRLFLRYCGYELVRIR